MNSNSSVIPLKAGLTLLSRGDLTEAERKFNESLRINPRQAKAMIGLAEIAQKRKQPELAAKLLNDALAIEPDNLNFRRSYIAFTISEGKFASAETALKGLAAANPKATAVYKDLGDLYLIHMNRKADAIAAFEKAVAIQQDAADLHVSLATALAPVDMPRAEKEFRTAASLDPHNGNPLYSLGLALSERKEFDRAVEAFNGALQAQPRMARALLARGDAYLFKGDGARAQADYRASAAAAPKDATPLTRLGDLQASTGQTEVAISSYEAAIKLDPNLASANNNVAFLLLSRKNSGLSRKLDLDAALKHAEAAVRLAPRTLEFQDTLAWVHHEQGEPAKAAEILQKIKSQNGNLPDVLYHLGVVYQEMGRPADAAKLYESALAQKTPFQGSADAAQRLQALHR